MTTQGYLTKQDLLGTDQVVSKTGWIARITLVAADKADLTDRLKLTNCDFRGSSFSGVKMSGADLRGSNLSKIELLHVDLQDANMGLSPEGAGAISATNMEGVKLLQSNLQRADLHRAILTDADLEGSDLQGANLQGARLTGVNLASVRLGGTRLDRGSLGSKIRQEMSGDFLAARFIYLELKTNFLSIGAYDDAGWAYVRERTMARKSWCPRNCARCYSEEYEQIRDRCAARLSGRFASWPAVGAFLTQIGRRVGLAAFYVKYTWKWLGDLLLATPWGYGQKPWNALIICLAIILAFALGSSLAGGIQTGSGGTPGASEYLVFSAGSFVSMSFNDLAPTSLLAKSLSVSEALFGLATFALFVNALGQRIGGR